MSKRILIIVVSMMNIIIAGFFMLEIYASSDFVICAINLFLLVILSPWMTFKLFNVFSFYKNQLIRICVSLILPGLTTFIFGFLSVVIFTFVNYPIATIFSRLMITPIYALMIVILYAFNWLIIGILNFLVLSILFRQENISK